MKLWKTIIYSVITLLFLGNLYIAHASNIKGKTDFKKLKIELNVKNNTKEKMVYIDIEKYLCQKKPSVIWRKKEKDRNFVLYIFQEKGVLVEIEKRKHSSIVCIGKTNIIKKINQKNWRKTSLKNKAFLNKYKIKIVSNSVYNSYINKNKKTILVKQEFWDILLERNRKKQQTVSSNQSKKEYYPEIRILKKEEKDFFAEIQNYYPQYQFIEITISDKQKQDIQKIINDLFFDINYKKPVKIIIFPYKIVSYNNRIDGFYLHDKINTIVITANGFDFGREYLKKVIAHEIGHYVWDNYFSDISIEEYKTIRKIDQIKPDMSKYENELQELFAEDFAVIYSGGNILKNDLPPITEIEKKQIKYLCKKVLI